MFQIRAGDLRQRVAFLEEASVQDATGQSVPAWTGVSGSTAVPAEVLGVGGGETFRGQQVEAHIASVVTIRYRAGLSPTMRLKHDGRQLNIDRIVDPTGHKRELTIFCTEIST